MIEQVQNGDSGLTVRTAINQAIDRVNSSGVQLLASASVDLNLPDVPLRYYRLSSGTSGGGSGKQQASSTTIGNAKLTYISASGLFTLYEYVTDDNGSTGTIFYNTTSSMSIAYIASDENTSGTASFAPGVGFRGKVSDSTAIVTTIVSESLLTPGELIRSIDSSSKATIVTSQSGSYTYGFNSEITSITGSFTIGYLTPDIGFKSWQPGETINDTTSGASATFIYQTIDGDVMVVKNVTGSFVTGDTISGSLSGNGTTLAADLTVGYNYNVVVGQTSKVAFPISNLFTSSNADQEITLSGGSKFVVTDVLMTNGVGTYVSASAGPALFTEPNQDGNLIAIGNTDTINDDGTSYGAIRVLLSSPSNYVNNIGLLNNFYTIFGKGSLNLLDVKGPIPIGGDAPTGIELPYQVTVGDTLYYSNVPNESAATADVYIYGYILS